MREIKSQLKALIDSVERMEETAEGQLLGGFAFISGGTEGTNAWNENCNCNCECNGNGNCNCNCGCTSNTNCDDNCKPTSNNQKGAGFTVFSF